MISYSYIIFIILLSVITSEYYRKLNREYFKKYKRYFPLYTNISCISDLVAILLALLLIAFHSQTLISTSGIY